MKFMQAIQAVCDEHNVKVAPGIALSDDGTVRATLMAYKLDSEGKVQKQMDLKQITPKKPEGK
jgi:hypothetical protein